MTPPTFSLIRRTLGLVCIIGCLFNISDPALAYEIEVHAQLSGRAFEKSVLIITDYLSQIGIDLDEKAVKKWVVDGSRFEDNNIRPLNHFYDPVTGSGLTVIGIPLGTDAINWALELRTLGTLTQDYSVEDAKDYLYSGLTGLDGSGNLVAGTRAERDEYLAKAFRSIGQVVHLLQDMAQPGHVRNDPHLSASENPNNLINYDHSLYEARTRDHPVAISDYPVVKFENYFSFWTGSGKGLADFTNANFVSEDTNFTAEVQGATDGTHPQPKLDLNDFTLIDIQQLEHGAVDSENNLLHGEVSFYGNYYTDLYTGLTDHNARMTTYSIFDRFLRDAGANPVFTLNNFNFDAQAEILLGRAEGYSAGLLDYFFRGRLSTPKTVSFNEARSTVSFKVFNQTPGEEAGAGEVILVARYQNSNFGEISVRSEPVSVPGLARTETETESITFAFSPNNIIPINAQDLRFTVVYRGRLGVEENAVMGYVFTPKPHYVFVIQDRVTLGSTGSSEGFICLYNLSITCETAYPHYNIIYAEEFRRWGWSILQQILTGRFVAYGTIKRISLANFNGSSTYSGNGKLFINNQEIVKGYWEIGDTPDPPANWQVEVHPSLVNVTYLLYVTMGDGSTFILSLASYRYLYQEVSKELGTPNRGIETGPPSFVITRSYVELDVDLGRWQTPDLLVFDTNLWELVQLSGSGPNSGFNRSRQEPIDNPIKFYRHWLGISIYSYQQESTFRCDPCFSNDSNTYALELYNFLPMPDPMPLTITGLYHRVYTQAELDALSALEIEPEYYDLVFD